MTALNLRSLRSGAAVALAALLSGCGVAGLNVTDGVVAPYESVYPIVVENGAELLEIRSLDGLAAAEAQRVDGFVAAYMQRGEGEITVAYPSDQAADETVEDVLRRFHRAGVPHDAVIRGPYSRAADGDRGVVISYFTPMAIGSGCPNYWGNTVGDSRNGRMIRLGCAVRQNLAAMTARPRDLLSPQPMTPADSEARSRALMAYRAGEDTRSADRIEITNTQN